MRAESPSPITDCMFIIERICLASFPCVFVKPTSILTICELYVNSQVILCAYVYFLQLQIVILEYSVAVKLIVNRNNHLQNVRVFISFD